MEVVGEGAGRVLLGLCYKPFKGDEPDAAEPLSMR